MLAPAQWRAFAQRDRSAMNAPAAKRTIELLAAMSQIAPE